MKFDDYVSNELYRDFAVLGVLIKHIQEEEHLVYESIMNQLGIVFLRQIGLKSVLFYGIIKRLY